MSDSKTIPKSAIPIALAFTANYVLPAAVTISSVLRNTESAERFHFICLMTEDFPPEIIQNLQKLGGERAFFSFINMAGRLQNIYIDDKYTVAASYRLLLPDLLPELDEVLYMDCDIIIQNNVAQLFRETSLDNFYMAGVFEAALPGQFAHLAEIDCEPGKYMNSGFLLMNLRRLRHDQMVPKFLEASKNDKLEFPDQDVINILCKDQLLGLAPHWNSIRTFLLPQYKGEFLTYYSEQEWKDVQKNGNVHYTGPKPWNSFTVKFDLWWRYYENVPLEIRQLSRINKKVYILYKIYANPIGGKLIRNLQYLYRKLRRHHE